MSLTCAFCVHRLVDEKRAAKYFYYIDHVRLLRFGLMIYWRKIFLRVVIAVISVLEMA